MEQQPWRHQPKILLLRDPMSGFLHFVGALLSVLALVILLTRAAFLSKPWHIVSFAIFGAGMVGLYTASTLCHWFQDPDKPSRLLEKLDHIMIFVLIAGTYTPICLVPLRGPWGWTLFGVVWGLAAIGTVLKLVRFHLPDWVNAAIYIAMGWVVLVAIVPLVETMQPGALLWLLIGAICYTVGGVMFAMRRPKIIKDVFSYHEIFHLLCIAGSFSFFWVMYDYVMQFD